MGKRLSAMDLEATIIDAGGSFNEMMDLYRKEMLPVFRCSHSGLFFPVDYLKLWGMNYGIGLGPTPVSEVLDTDYSSPLDMRPEVNRDNIMHPVQVTRSQVDLYYAHESELAGKMAIPAMDDFQVTRRMAVILPRQWANPKGLLHRYRPELAEQFNPLKKVAA